LRHIVVTLEIGQIIDHEEQTACHSLPSARSEANVGMRPLNSTVTEKSED